ncbi:MAG: DUF1844 domain-containing protein [Elusimicrobiota bacterium]|nr:DUF1844 domain-containing protein [Elusimicrobiota bacterium]
MSEGKRNIDERFVSLVLSLSSAAWHQLGKVPNPSTGKIEKNLNEAKLSIDFLEMLSEKTKGNLSQKEEKFLMSVLTDLRLNYVDELKREEAAASETDKTSKTDKTQKTDEAQKTGSDSG